MRKDGKEGGKKEGRRESLFLITSKGKPDSN